MQEIGRISVGSGMNREKEAMLGRCILLHWKPGWTPDRVHSWQWRLSAQTYMMQSEPCVGKVKLLAAGKMDGVGGRWVETLGRGGLEEP